MKRCLPLALSVVLVARAALAAEPTPTPSSPALQTLAEIRATLAKSADDPEAGAKAVAATAKVLALVEKDAFSTGDEFEAASQLVLMSDSRYRAARSQYELTLVAAVKGNAEARKRIAETWDQLLLTMGRPLRTNAGKATRLMKAPVDLAAPCVRAVLLDPEQARVAAQSATANPEMQRIVDADQADRRTPSVDWKVVGPRDDERNRRTREILAAGELHTGSDFANAALVMQHSDDFAGYEVAHELAVCSTLVGGPRLGRWLVAATYDRMLGSVGHDQRFGTQYIGMGGAMTLQRTDTFGIGDAERLALGCPTLEAAAHRDMKPKAAPAASTMQSVTVEELTREPGVVRDAKYGFSVACPPGWSLVHALRWGDQQNTWHFEAPAHPDAHPSLYYIAYHTAKPMTDEALLVWYRDEARKKEESRREGLSDYRNRPDSLAARTIAGRPAFSWTADFTAPDGGKYVEYMVDVRNDAGNAFFFLQAPAADVEKLRPAVDALMAGITMPHVTP